MKYIVKFFVITFFVFHFSHTFAEDKIVFNMVQTYGVGNIKWSAGNEPDYFG